MRAQLGQILEHAARVGEVAADDVPPTASPIPRANVFREDVPEPSLPVEEALRNAPERGRRPVPRAADRGDRRVSTELCDLTGAELSAKLAAGETSAVRAPRRPRHARIDAVDGQVGAFLTPTRELALERAEELDALPADRARRSRPSPASRSR